MKLLFAVAMVLHMSAVLTNAMNQTNETEYDSSDRNCAKEGDNDRAAELPRPRDSVLACQIRRHGLERPGLLALIIESIPKGMCTHVVYSHVQINPASGELRLTRRRLGSDIEWLRRLHCLKKSRPKLKLMLTYGDGRSGRELMDMMDKESLRGAFVRSAVLWIMRFGFDGLNLHWEGPGPSLCEPHVTNLYNLLKMLRSAFKEHKLLLTVQLPLCREGCESELNKKILASLVDYLFLMAYDYDGDIPGMTNIHTMYHASQRGTNSQRQNTERCANSWLTEGVPRSKMVIGLALFGNNRALKEESEGSSVNQTLRPGNSLGRSGYITNTEGLLSYTEICRNLQWSDWTKDWYNYSQSPFAYHNDEWVSYEDNNSIALKAGWLKSAGVAGVFLSSLDMDDHAGRCSKAYPLLRAAYDALKYYRAPKGAKERRCKMPHYGIEVKCDSKKTPSLPDYTDCARYFRCIKGNQELFRCRDETTWNNAKAKCVPAGESDREECLISPEATSKAPTAANATGATAGSDAEERSAEERAVLMEGLISAENATNAANVIPGENVTLP